MGRDYQRLDIVDFGRELLRTGDLDPIYLGLHRAALPRPQLHRWLLAYWCFYDAGVASFMSEKEGLLYWQAMEMAAVNGIEHPAPIPAKSANGGWPRGKERRHFRGLQGIKAMAELAERFERPESALISLSPGHFYESYFIPDSPDRLELVNTGAVEQFAVINKRVQEWRGFGDWIAFKVGDMLERCAGVPVNFTEAEIFMFKDPWQAAIMVWKSRHPEIAAMPNFTLKEEPAVKEVVSHLLGIFRDELAPPDFKRPVNLQEIETILCKWKSSIHGHYPPFNDTIEIRGGLEPWAKFCRTAENFLECMPALPANRGSW